MRPTPPDGSAGVTVTSDDVSDTAVPNASKAHIKPWSCSIFCDASTVDTVVDLASAFMRSVCREIPASATVAVVARTVATRTSIREEPRSTGPLSATSGPMENPWIYWNIWPLHERIRVFATGKKCEIWKLSRLRQAIQGLLEVDWIARIRSIWLPPRWNS